MSNKKKVFKYDELSDDERKTCQRIRKKAKEKGLTREKFYILEGIDGSHPAFQKVQFSDGTLMEYYETGFAEHDEFLMEALVGLIKSKNVNAINKAVQSRLMEYNQRINEEKELRKHDLDVQRVMYIGDINDLVNNEVPPEVDDAPTDEETEETE